MSGRILLAHKVASKNGIALFKTPDPPVELFEAVKAFHLVQYGQEKVERAVQRSSNVLRWMMESRRFQQDQTSLPKMVDELVKDKMPLAYILGDQPFGGLNIMVEPPVLIPRPETEEWVMRLLRIMTKSKEDILAPCRVLDLCSGSGCVSLALAKHAPVGFYTGLDISEKAVNIAQHNADIHDLNNIMFKQVDIFDDAALEAAKLARYDIIVANPPYIPPREYETLDASVKDWEDKHALVGHYRASGRTQLDGLDFYHRIREISDKYLAKEEKRALTHHTPRLVLEFGKGQAQAVQEIFKDKKTVIQRDFNLLERSIDIYDDLEVEKEREARERRSRADSRFDDFHDENLKMYSLY